MPQHADILDQREPVKRGFFGSLALHGALAGMAVLWSFAGASQIERWGDPKSLGGGATTVTPVAGIRIPKPVSTVNPVANDTESQIPAPPKPQPKPAQPKPDPDAIELKSRNAQTRPAPPAAKPRYVPPDEKSRPNQVYSQTGKAATSPLFTPAPGGGGVGSGTGSPFGYRFGAYEQLIREQIARNWSTLNLDSRSIRNRVAISFDILRNGSLRNIRVTQSSGHFQMDQSAQRAITLSNPLPPLPTGFERDVATVEFWFGLTQQ